ncbi:uncharacterized protein LOC130648190 [Hydractinia symbiolongicarpus]|uniref:uncharacterized protein LOC130648190 n=1 Tax=Hydractinia symbiolongicarpus TaxID=13093 RepID=UPI00254A4F08|nr:uncharacterized protein LOC130648190 [Hydractinia symbiolongicarpus]
MHLGIDFHKLQLTRGSSYIDLPAWILREKAVINPRNEDEECFKWALIAAMHHGEIANNPQRISNLRPFVDQYNWEGFEFTVALNKIGKFEEQNPECAVNMLFVSDKTIYIGHRSEYNIKRDKQANLLMITDGESKYYTAVKSESARESHYDYCTSHGEVNMKMPTENEKWLQYQDDQPEQPKAKKGGDPYTEKLAHHVPCAWCLYSTFAYGDVPDPLRLYSGKNCVEKLVDILEKEIRRLYSLYPQQPMTELTDVLKRGHEAAESCHICLKPFGNPENRKVRDHCHYMELYRSAAHDLCNLRYWIPSFVPVAFHNLSGYDAHLFIREFGRKLNKDNVSVIAGNKEKHISFSVSIPVTLAGLTDRNGKPVEKMVELRFIDSYRFMGYSLDALACSLTDKQCKHLRRSVEDNDELFKLMRRKGVYPYEYVDSWGRFKERIVAPKKAFYSKLNMKGISDEDYEHAQKVCNWMCDSW